MNISEYLFRNISSIRKESHYWRNRELLEEDKSEGVDLRTPKQKFISFFLGVMLLALLILVSYFNSFVLEEKIVTFIITVLSIYIGLFVSVLIFALDKFLNIKQFFSLKKDKSDYDDISYTRTKNYIKRFSSVLLETLLLALLCIVLFSIVLVSKNFFLQDLADDFIVADVLDLKALICFFEYWFIFLFKLMVMYTLFNLVKYVLFIISSLGEFVRSLLD